MGALPDARIELRCPSGTRKLLAALVFRGSQEDPPKVTDHNLIEVSCTPCVKVLRVKLPSAFRVLHRYDISGDYVESEVICH